MTVPCCVDPRNHRGNTYAKGYTVCGKCNRRFYLTDRGWQANPDPAPRKYGR